VAAPRAMVYHWSALAGLADLGILDRAIAAGFTKDDYAVHVPRTGETIHYSTAPLEAVTPYPFNLHLGQDRLARIGLSELQRLPNAEIHFGWELAGIHQGDHGVTAVSAGDEQLPEVSGSWLIGADGAGSRVRQLLGLAFDGMTWDERFVATDIHYDFRALGFARSTMVVDPDIGAIVVLAEDDGDTGLWRYTFSEDLSLPEDEVGQRARERLAEALPHGDQARIERLSPYRMHQRSASTMRVDRVLLAGDAGHATNPTGGLGLTSGLFDTYALYPALAAVIQGRLPESVLDHWAAERLRIFRELTSPAATENKRFVYNSTDPERLERDLVALRSQLADPDRLLARLRFTEALMTPSLITTVGAA
jgi:3-(3-hydroxy-phenyl)propionate hydroxylase